MNADTFALLESYMLQCMEDSAHDKEHIYRVLYNALRIAAGEDKVDFDVLICSCLLHDIGRKEQYENANICHAIAGGEKAYRFLLENGFPLAFAQRVQDCIQSHRFRKSSPPQSLEAKILFDADKLDVCGALGIARSLLYVGIVSEPLYSLFPDGTVSDGEYDEEPSFFYEYKFKLEKLYDCFYTETGKKLALNRRKAAVDFYESIYREVSISHREGQELLRKLLENQ